MRKAGGGKDNDADAPSSNLSQSSRRLGIVGRPLAMPVLPCAVRHSGGRRRGRGMIAGVCCKKDRKNVVAMTKLCYDLAVLQLFVA